MFTVKSKLTMIMLLLFVFGLVSIHSANAGSVHALVVIMDDDERVGEAMKVNHRHLIRLLNKVDESYTVDRTDYLSSKGRTRPNNILNWVKSVNPRPDDVVLIYYGGHGGMDATSKRTYLYLTDGNLYRDNLEAEMKKHLSCRLKILITDACSSVPVTAAERLKPQNYRTDSVGKSHIRDLFGEHKGFLHLTAATEGEFAWCNDSIGGVFTSRLMEYISEDSDTDKDGNIEWSEVFALAKMSTQERFTQMYNGNALPSEEVDIMKKRGTLSQTPKSYLMPRFDPTHDRRNPNIFADDLWDLKNYRARFDVKINTTRSRYRIQDYITFDITAQEDCYITILNWDEDDTFTVLLPNEHEPEVRLLRKGQKMTFPDYSRDRFRLKLFGPAGKERYKIIAVSTEAAKRPIEDALSLMLSKKDRSDKFLSLRTGAVLEDLPRRSAEEKKLLDALEKLDKDDWSVMNYSIRVDY